MIRYRLATEEDNQQLVELTAASGMSGTTALRIDRRPDFFALLRLRGESRVFVAEDESRIVGSLSVSLQHVYLDGEVLPVHYIGDFKVAEAYRRTGIGSCLCDELIRYGLEIKADLFFLTVAGGNSKPFSFFGGRQHLPDFKNIGTFHVHQFPGKMMRFKSEWPQVEPSGITNELLEFFNLHYRGYDLGSVVTADRLKDTLLYVIRGEGKILGAICLIDTLAVKQNVITRLPWKLKYAIKFLNAVRGLFSLSKLPTVNETVRTIYIRYLAVKDGNREMIRRLVGHAQKIAYEKSYSFASLGLHEKDPVNLSLNGLFKFTFYSVGMLISIRDNQQLVDKVKNGIPFEDYSLV